MTPVAPDGKAIESGEAVKAPCTLADSHALVERAHALNRLSSKRNVLTLNVQAAASVAASDKSK